MFKDAFDHIRLALFEDMLCYLRQEIEGIENLSRAQRDGLTRSGGSGTK